MLLLADRQSNFKACHVSSRMRIWRTAETNFLTCILLMWYVSSRTVVEFISGKLLSVFGNFFLERFLFGIQCSDNLVFISICIAQSSFLFHPNYPESVAFIWARAREIRIEKNSYLPRSYLFGMQTVCIQPPPITFSRVARRNIQLWNQKFPLFQDYKCFK